MSREFVNKRRGLNHVLACGVSLIAMTCHIGTAAAVDISSTTAGPILTSGDDIVIQSGGTITTDDSDVAVTIDTDNSVTIDDGGLIDADDVGAIGILVSTDTTTGGITNQGTIISGAPEADDDGGEAGGGAIVVNANLGGGISNEFLVDDYAGTITSYGKYGILVHADVVSGNVAVGAVGTGDKDFSIYNQAVIIGNSNIVDAADADRITVTAIRVEGEGGSTATLTKGIHNDGENASISVLGYMADSVQVIFIGDDASVLTIKNSGTILATHIGTDTDGVVTEGNVKVVAIHVESGGSLPSITNELDASADDPLADSAQIRAISTLEGVDVVAIQDLSGTLALIDNEGTITATSAAEDDATVITKGSAIAIDVSANTTGFTLDNSGEITGDILLGSGGDTINITGGFIDGVIDFGNGVNVLNISGGGSFTTSTDITTTTGSLNVLVDGGTLVIEEAGFTATTVTITDSDPFDEFDSTIEVQWDPSSPVPPDALLIADDVTIGGDTIIDVELMAYTATTQTIDVARATSTLLIDLPNLVVGGIAAGYNATIFEVGSILRVEIARKSATDLSLNANQTALYNNAATALESETVFGAAVGNLQTEAEVVAAYQDMLPDLTGANEDLAMMLQDTSSGMIQDRLKQLRPLFAASSTSKSSYRTGYEWGTSEPRQQTGFWGQEGYGAIESTAGSAGEDYEGTLYSFAFGVDSRAKDGSIFGLSFNYGVLDYEPADAVDDANKASSYLLSAYYSDNMGVLFWDTVATVGLNEYNQTRRVTAGDEERLPTASWLGYQAGIQAQVGYVAKLGRTAITPTIGASYTYLTQDSYEEEDGQSMNLAYDSRSFNSLRTNVGMRIEHAFGSGDIIFIPSLHAAWSHDFIGDAPEVTAAFVSGGNKFTVTGDETDPDTIYAGAGVTMVFEIGQLDFSYEVQTGDTLTNHALMATLGVAL